MPVTGDKKTEPTGSKRNGASRKARRRRRSRRHNPDGTMSLIDHLYELRYRLGLALLAIGLGGVLGFIWFSVEIGPISSLGDLILRPYRLLTRDHADLVLQGTDGKLLQTEVFEGFMVRLKVGLATGAVLTSPAWLYQLWAFITPGLYAKERKFARIFVGAAVVLFVGGAVLAYFVAPEALLVLSGISSSEFVTALTADKYISFLLALLLIFGVSFELPLLVVMLNRVGILPYAKLAKWRRGIIFGLFCFAAVATPGQDPISMCVLAGALTVLFEAAVQISRLHDKAIAKRERAEGLADLPDDQPSPLPKPYSDVT